MNKDDKNILELFGIEIKDSEVSIDFKKAKETIKSISQKLDNLGDKVKESIKEGKIEIPIVGIDSNPKSFEIDLNQTKETLNSLAKKLSNLDETIQNQSNQTAVLSFEIESNKCQVEEIEKILGLESKSKESWIVSSSEFELSKLKDSSKKFTQFLEPIINELKRVKKECKASLTLKLKLNSTPKESISLSKETIKFLNRVGGEFVLS